VHDCWELSSMLIWIMTKPGAWTADGDRVGEADSGEADQEDGDFVEDSDAEGDDGEGPGDTT
ncbi:MAG: hypothetical protein ACKPHU_23140, partial [Planctomycetaceae bacterium]